MSKSTLLFVGNCVKIVCKDEKRGEGRWLKQTANLVLTITTMMSLKNIAVT